MIEQTYAYSHVHFRVLSNKADIIFWTMNYKIKSKKYKQAFEVDDKIIPYLVFTQSELYTEGQILVFIKKAYEIYSADLFYKDLNCHL